MKFHETPYLIWKVMGFHCTYETHEIAPPAKSRGATTPLASGRAVAVAGCLAASSAAIWNTGHLILFATICPAPGPPRRRLHYQKRTEARRKKTVSFQEAHETHITKLLLEVRNGSWDKLPQVRFALAGTPSCAPNRRRNAAKARSRRRHGFDIRRDNADRMSVSSSSSPMMTEGAIAARSRCASVHRETSGKIRAARRSSFDVCTETVNSYELLRW